MTDERKYTLNEARIELARQECRQHGHSWRVESTYQRPVRILCVSCGETYNIAPD